MSIYDVSAEARSNYQHQGPVRLLRGDQGSMRPRSSYTRRVGLVMFYRNRTNHGMISSPPAHSQVAVVLGGGTEIG